ncbi:CPBP family intramembrane glutamic endopeptidase [Scatolibacter rhodanostii]|uniref:CPBP family intramembrane glutamic endopeptidase n=1 Tax=Scatolibacter rhodanostii TaxID=2014781 RepID=UPI000C08B7A3|nr:type II CAAX endopeptidase family protein [Scatolibacter rhodanostii]
MNYPNETDFAGKTDGKDVETPKEELPLPDGIKAVDDNNGAEAETAKAPTDESVQSTAELPRNPGYAPPYATQPMYGYAPQAVPAMPYSFWDPMKAKRKLMRSSVNSAGFILIGTMMAMLILSAIFGAVVQFLAQAGKFDFFASYEQTLYWFQSSLSAVSFLIPTLIFIKTSKFSLGSALKFEKGDFLYKLCFIFLGVGAAFLSNIPGQLVSKLVEYLGFRTAEAPVPSEMTADLLLPYLLQLVIIAPLVEEFVCRGVILSALEKHGQLFAITTSGLLFGLMHGDIASMVVASIAGMLFGLIYIKTRNLWVTVVIHALYNLTATISSYSYLFVEEETALLISNLLTVIPILLSVVALIVLFTVYRSKMFDKRKSDTQKLKAVSYPSQPGMLYPSNVAPMYWEAPVKFSQIVATWFTSVPVWILIVYVAFNFVATNLML